MQSRRDFLKRSSLIATSALVPGFLARTARAAEPGKDTILVVLEMTGGNDGLNTVIPYADDLYHKARPTLGVPSKQVVKIDDDVGLHPGLQSSSRLLEREASSRSCRASATRTRTGRTSSRWTSGSRPTRSVRRDRAGWPARPRPGRPARAAGCRSCTSAATSSPLALPGAARGVSHRRPGRSRSSSSSGCPAATEEAARKKLIEDLAAGAADDRRRPARRSSSGGNCRRYTAVEKLEEAIAQGPGPTTPAPDRVYGARQPGRPSSTSSAG